MLSTTGASVPEDKLEAFQWRLNALSSFVPLSGGSAPGGKKGRRRGQRKGGGAPAGKPQRRPPAKKRA
jgi:hypothetical protein